MKYSVNLHQSLRRFQIYRAYIIYDRQRLVPVFHGLMYLASICAVSFPGSHVLTAHVTTSDGCHGPLPDVQTQLQSILWHCSQLLAPVLCYFCRTQRLLDYNHRLAAPPSRAQPRGGAGVRFRDQFHLHVCRHRAHRELCHLCRRLDLFHRPLRHVAPRVFHPPLDTITNPDYRTLAYHPPCGDPACLNCLERNRNTNGAIPEYRRNQHTRLSLQAYRWNQPWRDQCHYYNRIRTRRGWPWH